MNKNEITLQRLFNTVGWSIIATMDFVAVRNGAWYTIVKDRYNYEKPIRKRDLNLRLGAGKYRNIFIINETELGFLARTEISK